MAKFERALTTFLLCTLAGPPLARAAQPAERDIPPNFAPGSRFELCGPGTGGAVGTASPCPAFILLDRTGEAAAGVFSRAFIGRNPMPLGEVPLVYMQNRAPTVRDAVDVDLQRDERGLVGGEEGFINTLQRNACSGGRDVTSWVFCGLDMLTNYSDHGENVARAAQATKLSAGPTWAMVAEAMDPRNEGDPTSGLIAEEFDIRAAGGDAHHNRIDLGIVASQPNGKPENGTWLPTTVGYGIDFLTLDNTLFDIALRLDGRYHKGLDCSAASVSIGCVILGDNQAIVLSSDGSQQIKGNDAIIQASGTFGAGGGFQVNGKTSVGFDCREGDLASGCIYARDDQALVLSTHGTQQFSATDSGGFVFRDIAAGALLTVSSDGVVATRPVKLPTYAVASLPPCSAPLQDAIVIVTDAIAPTYRAAISGGGKDRTLVECDGAAWTAH